MYERYFNVIKKDALSALKVSTSKKQNKSSHYALFPNIISTLMKVRKMGYHVKVGNR